MPIPSQAGESPRRAADRIRASARMLFYRQGIRAVGVDEVVAHAGVTKPSLYRAFASKDELAAACLREHEQVVWSRFERVAAAHPDDARAQLRAYFAELEARMREPEFRGCPLTNAAVEYPQPGHPVRVAAESHKRRVFERLVLLCGQAGAKKPAELAGGLCLLVEGAYACVQLFGPDGPQGAVSDAAEALVSAGCA